MSRYFKRVVSLSKRPQDFRQPSHDLTHSPTTVVADSPATVVDERPAGTPDYISSIPRSAVQPAITVVTDPKTTVVVDTSPVVELCPAPGGIKEAPVPTKVDDHTATTGVAEIKPGAEPEEARRCQSSATVGADSQTTVVADSATPVTIVAGLWQAEANGAVFPASRLRRIERAQDALTHSEEAVYDFLWGRKNIERDEYRLTEAGYDRIANAARITKRNVALIIERLIDKGFIRIERPPDPMHRMPAQYRVLGYRAALDEIHRRGREWVVRTGNGVLFVRPVTVVSNSSTTVVAGQPTTVDPATTVTVVAGQPTTVVATTTLLDIKETRSQSSSSLVSTIATNYFPIDDDAVRRLIQRCRVEDPSATENEIAYFVEAKVRQLRNRGNIENWVGMLLTSVPLYFRPPATELGRYRETKAAAEQESREAQDQVAREARKILEDPDASESDKAMARSWLPDSERDIS